MKSTHSPRNRSDEEYGLSQLFRNSLEAGGSSVPAILDQLLKATRIHMGMDIAFISQFEGGMRVFRHVDKPEGMEMVNVGACDPVDETYCKKVVEGQLPELIHNAQELSEARKLPATERIGVGAHLSVPIKLSDDTIFGTFCCFSFQVNHSLNERDVSLIRTFANIAAELVEQDVQYARQQQVKKERIENLLYNDDFSMVWQPIREIASARITGVEALARFPREPHATPPGWFDEAASVGLAGRLEMRAIEKGLQAIHELPQDAYVACNCSAAAIVAAGGIAPFQDMPLNRIVLEITEHDVIDDYEALAELITPLRQQGLRVAVDDAGAGYASFRHILQLRPDLIKLDMSLTRDIDCDIGRRSLALSLVQFAREIDSTLVAEGVETQEELDTLADLGVELAQGYLLHQPQSLKNLVAGPAAS